MQVAIDETTLLRAWKSPCFELTGAHVLVTGAAGHLGSAVAAGLCAAGAHVYLNGRDELRLQTLYAWLKGREARCSVHSFDLTDPAAVRGFIQELQAGGRKLNGIVNNAYSGETGDLDHVTPERVSAATAVNLTAPLLLAQAARPLLREPGPIGTGSIVNISSMYAHVSPDPHVYDRAEAVSSVEYGATKAAMIQMTRHLACSLGSEGIRVNSVSPGPFPRQCDDVNAFHSRLSRRVPLGRLGQAHEVVGAVTFLISGAASYITGADIRVDGGWTAW